MKTESKKKIAIVWEGFEAGGVDSYLSYLLNSWPVEDEIHIFHNSENAGIDRLKTLLECDNVRFQTVCNVFRYYNGKTPLSLFTKYIMHIATPLLFLINTIIYKRVFSRQSFDVLIAQNGGYPGSYGVVSSCFGAYSAGIKVKALVIHHAANSPLIGHKIFRYIIERYLTKTLTSVIAISQATKDTVTNRTKLFKDAHEKITVIENGIPVPIRKKIFTSDNKKKHKIAIIGRLDPHKGHDDFLKALSMISEEEINQISVEFIGGYKDEDYDRISGLIFSLGLQDHVKITGYLDLSITEIILKLDLVVMVTKDFEGFGLTIIEALHTGVPVLVTRVGIVPDLFPPGDIMAVEPRDINAIALALSTFVQKPNKQDLISKAVSSKLKYYDSKVASARYREHLFRSIH